MPGPGVAIVLSLKPLLYPVPNLAAYGLSNKDYPKLSDFCGSMLNNNITLSWPWYDSIQGKTCSFLSAKL